MTELGQKRRLSYCAAISRRTALSGLACSPFLLSRAGAQSDAATPFRFGLTPVFLSNDLELLSKLKTYLTASMGRPVQLITRRTYQEITALLVSGQIDAAWICGYPYVQYRDVLSLVGVPVWRGQPLYQSYLVCGANRAARSIDDLQGDIHSFSDPDSNSGFLVTRALLAERHTDPERFFSRHFFTYGHRNVIRAVSSGLAQSGSVDGYVWEVVAEIEPEIVGATRVVSRSEWLGFPPICCKTDNVRSTLLQDFDASLTTMADEPAGREILALLKLDGFAHVEPTLFDSIATKVALVSGA